uniref:Uncharacterized protein n=1 Tax=Hyaloperonospora arabidopsidis (strain Emoy2) TaxID=559515 RepID=M4B2Q6_HYAAE
MQHGDLGPDFCVPLGVIAQRNAAVATDVDDRVRVQVFRGGGGPGRVRVRMVLWRGCSSHWSVQKGHGDGWREEVVVVVVGRGIETVRRCRSSVPTCGSCLREELGVLPQVLVDYVPIPSQLATRRFLQSSHSLPELKSRLGHAERARAVKLGDLMLGPIDYRPVEYTLSKIRAVTVDDTWDGGSLLLWSLLSRRGIFVLVRCAPYLTTRFDSTWSALAHEKSH